VARFILRRADWIFSRDRAGVDEAAALAGRTKRPIRYCPDVAFCLDVKPVEAPRIDPPLPAAAGPSIMGLNVNGLMFSGGYTRRNMFGLSVDYPRFVTLLVRRILEDESARLLLVPHTFGPPGDVNSDPDACQAVMAALDPAVRPRVHLVAHAYDEMSLKAIIGRCGFFIGSRMHSCIAALSQGIPTVGIAYSDKFHGIFESVGVADMVVDARRATQDEALDRILTLYRDRERRRPALASGAAAVREQIARTFESLVADVVRGERACG
jgi:polysaccharide pyruvyl transferase WcaK-like protein